MPIYDHPYHIKLEDGAILWRYMSFEKYKSLLADKALFFCRADKFADPYEGSITKKEFEYRLSEDKFAKEEAVFGRYDSKFDLDLAKKKAEGVAFTHKKVRSATTVNCWHINNNESDAMWQLYLKDNEGVAVKTSKEKLFAAIQGAKENISISKVRYINYDSDIWYNQHDFPINGYNFLTPLFHKRVEFAHEKELRLYHHDTNREKAVFWENQSNQTGELINIDINTLVDSVVFHPTSDKATQEKIIALTRTYAYDFKFELSRLSTEPLY